MLRRPLRRNREPHRQGCSRILVPVQQAVVGPRRVGVVLPEPRVPGGALQDSPQGESRDRQWVENVRKSPVEPERALLFILEGPGFPVRLPNLEQYDIVFPGPLERVDVVEDVVPVRTQDAVYLAEYRLQV